MVLIRHTSTDVELDVPDEAVPYFPDYEPVAEDKPQRGARKSEPTTTTEE